MIELRWVDRDCCGNNPHGLLIHGQTGASAVRVLQYRTVGENNVVHGFGYGWCDWKDVPTVKEQP